KPELRFRDAVRPQVPQKSEKENLTFRTMSIEDYRKMIDSAVPPAAKPAKPQAANIAMPKEEKRSFEAKKPLVEPEKTYTQPVKMPEPEPCREPAKAEILPKEETAPKVIETAPTPIERPSPIVNIEAEVKKNVRVIGEAMRTYIIVEEEEGLLLIDKHAAHERIIFERLRSEQEAPVSQLLMVPEVVKLTQKEAQVLFEQLDVINAAGFEAEEFGDDCLIVRQVPSCIDAPDAQTVLQQLADELLEGRNMSPEHKREQLLYRVACRAAIKAGRQSSYAELKALAEEVVSREDIRYCPHGRPVTVSITKATLDKQFGR
ncbi:MAG: hypothetical protein IKM51_01055, partial [Oscillospiraceae bacterium]|nr:hypothetical protein [Oscillospiraceae bacterium]